MRIILPSLSGRMEALETNACSCGILHSLKLKATYWNGRNQPRLGWFEFASNRGVEEVFTQYADLFNQRSNGVPTF